MDPTIPQHPRRRGRNTTSGFFVEKGETVVLRDRWGNTFALQSVTIMSGTFGFDHDGFEKLPRPWKYDDDGKVVVRGDVVVIDFLDGNPKTPVVRGGARQATADDFLARNHGDVEAPYNRCRARLRALDADGAVQGEVRLRVNDGADGDVKVQATGALELFVGDDLDADGGIYVTIGGGVVTVRTAAGTSEGVILGKTFLSGLSTALADIIAGLALVPYVATVVTTFRGQVDAAVSAEGAPYLSTKLTTE